MKKKALLAMGGALALACLTGCSKSASDENTLYLYNWGEYIDEDIFEQFEEETGIKVEISYFDTNEDMYAIVDAGATVYDLVCPSDYMVTKMIENDLLAEINWDNVPNAKNIGSSYMEMASQFDPGNKYCMPYFCGTVGILYNTTMVDEEVTSWDILWDDKYKNNILMQKSSRDSLMVALKKLGYSCNTTNADELKAATNLLIEQKPLVQGYFIDQVRDKMIGNEAALALIYSGEYMMCKASNDDLAYVVPEEGGNFWIDGWVIPKNAEHKENAEKFLDFLCRPEIALKNFECIGYATPNVEAQKLIDAELLNDPGIFPSEDMMKNCEIYIYNEELEKMYNDAWEEVMAH